MILNNVKLKFIQSNWEIEFIQPDYCNCILSSAEDQIIFGIIQKSVN